MGGSDSGGARTAGLNCAQCLPLARDRDADETLSSAAAEMGRKGGKKRAESMTPERRKEIAQAAAAKRWNK